MVFRDWAARGFDTAALIPIIPPGAVVSENSGVLPEHRGKVPGMLGVNGWHSYNWRGTTATSRQKDTAESQGCNIGLMSGKYPGLDIDVTSAELAEQIEAMALEYLGPACIRTGRAPKRLMVYAAEAPFPKHKIKFTVGLDTHVVELLAEGQQYVVEGTHPGTGKPYSWDVLPDANGLTPISPLEVGPFFNALKEFISALPGASFSTHTSELPGEELVPPETLDAPSEQDLIEAVRQWPNTTDLYPKREDYIAVAYSIRAAGRKYPDTALTCWQEWCAKWEGYNDPEVVQSDWDRCKPPHRLGWSFIERELSRCGVGLGAPEFPLTSDEITHAPLAAPLPDGFDVSKIALRPWLLGTRFLRGAVTAGLGAPGVSKSTMSILSAIAVATGRGDLTGEIVHETGRVWIHNNEDDEAEMLRRIGGMLKHYGLDPAPLRHRILISSGAVKRLRVAVKKGDVVVIDESVAEIIAQIKSLRIVLMAVDPFVSTHDGVGENSNEEVEKVINCFRRIAAETNCAIDLVHHTVKNHSGNTEARAGDMNAARGASALIGAVRVSYTLSPMSEKTAATLGLDPEASWRFVRLDPAKGNYAPRDRRPRWFELVSVDLGNGGEGFNDVSDSVGVPVAHPDLEQKLREAQADAAEENEAELRRSALLALVDAVGTAPVKLSDAVASVGTATGLSRSAAGKLLSELFGHAGGDQIVTLPDGKSVTLVKHSQGRAAVLVKKPNVRGAT